MQALKHSTYILQIVVTLDTQHYVICTVNDPQYVLLVTYYSFIANRRTTKHQTFSYVRSKYKKPMAQDWKSIIPRVEQLLDKVEGL